MEHKDFTQSFNDCNINNSSNDNTTTREKEKTMTKKELETQSGCKGAGTGDIDDPMPRTEEEIASNIADYEAKLPLLTTIENPKSPGIPVDVCCHEAEAALYHCSKERAQFEHW
ncbi:MAG: hypothetical protein GY765_35610 [bacterium]|nr:hypothetical protein [bacterium]